MGSSVGSTVAVIGVFLIERFKGLRLATLESHAEARSADQPRTFLMEKFRFPSTRLSRERLVDSSQSRPKNCLW